MRDARWEPARDFRTGDPLFLEETAGLLLEVPEPVGMTLAEVERPEVRHMCGACRNPFTREGNPECRNR